MGADTEIKDYADYKRAVKKSDYRAIKALKDSKPTMYADFKIAMKKEDDKRRGIIEF
jgi:hypothetical protein